MKKQILILGNPKSWSTQAIANEVIKAGHISVVREPGDIFPFLSEAQGHDRIYFRSRENEKAERLFLKDIDGVVTRLGAGTRYGKYVVRAFQNAGIFCANIAECVEVCGDKFHTSQQLSKARVPVPKQLLIFESKDPEEAIGLVDKKPPIICKKISGSEGRGVFVLADALSGKMALESFSDTYLVLQRFLNKNSTEKKSDIRAFTIGGETSDPEIYSYERISRSDDPRSNFSIHHSGRPIDLTEEERNMVLRAARATGGGILGIDVIRDKDTGRPFVIEVNSNPSLAGISEVLNINIAERVVNYVLRECDRPKKNAPFYNGITEASFDFPPSKPDNDGKKIQMLSSLIASVEKKAAKEPFSISDFDILKMLNEIKNQF